jgi:hypothetical protein
MTVWSPLAIARYRKILARERLNPKRIGWNPNFCDEFPIFSKIGQLGEITKWLPDKRDELILRMAVQFWLEAEANLIALPFSTSYMLFLSIWHWDDDDVPQPYVFFCGSEPEKLRDKLTLTTPRSDLAARISRILQRFEIGSSAHIFEDHETEPGEIRLLIDFDLASNPKKLRLSL